MFKLGQPTEFVKNIVFNYNNLPTSQKLKCYMSDTYKFERERLGKIISPSETSQYGKYLYRNLRNGVLISSYDKPTGKSIYTSKDIGFDIGEAFPYYKNE